MAAFDPVQYRLDDHGRRIGGLEVQSGRTDEKVNATVKNVEGLKEGIKALDEKIDEKVGSMVKALYVAAVSFAASAVGLSLTAYAIWGKQ